MNTSLTSFHHFILAFAFACALISNAQCDGLKMRWATSTELSKLQIVADTGDQTRAEIIQDIFDGKGRFRVYNGNENFKIHKLIMKVRRVEHAPDSQYSIRSEDTNEYSANPFGDVLTTVKFTIEMPPVKTLGRDSSVTYDLINFRALGEDTDVPYVVDENGDIKQTANVKEMQQQIDALKKEVAAQKKAKSVSPPKTKPSKVKVVYCSNCGRKLNAYWKFCVDCGTKVANTETNVSVKATK